METTRDCCRKKSKEDTRKWSNIEKKRARDDVRKDKRRGRQSRKGDDSVDKSKDCENIHSWISLVGDLAFSHQGGIYGFKFPTRFSGDLFLRSLSFTLFLNESILKAQPSESMPFPFAFAWLNVIQAVRHSHSLSDPVLH
jgi:hypothetical protein